MGTASTLTDIQAKACLCYFLSFQTGVDQMACPAEQFYNLKIYHCLTSGNVHIKMSTWVLLDVLATLEELKQDLVKMSY